METSDILERESLVDESNKPVGLDENPAEIRELAAKAKETGNEFQYNKLTELANEIEDTHNLNSLMNAEYKPFVYKFVSSLSKQKELITKVYKKLNNNKKFGFIPMDKLQNVETEIGENFVYFKAAFYAYLNAHRSENVSYFQPKIMALIRNKNPEFIDKAKEIANFYKG